MIVNNNTLPEGFILKDEYKIVGVLGEGGFGITYRAIDINLNRECAIKEYFPSFSVRNADTTFVAVKSKSDAEVFDLGLKSFFKEAQTLARFEHPNIVKIYRVFKENGTGYFVMPFEKGVTLEEYINKHKLTEKEVISLSIGILNGLKEAHKHGIIHRDIKPDNIFIKENGLPMLIDFGASKDAIGVKSKSLAQILTPGYAPIEQYGNYSFKQGPWTDIYAFGMTLYRIISGNKNLPTSTDRLLMITSGKEDPLVMPELGKYSEGLLSIIKTMVNVKPNERPQSVDKILGYFKKLVTSPTPPDLEPENEKTSPTPPDLEPENEKTSPTPPHGNEKAKFSKKLLLFIVVVIVVAVLVFWYMNRKGELDVYLPSDNLIVKIDDEVVNSHKGLNIIKAPVGNVKIEIKGDLYKDYHTILQVKADKVAILEATEDMQIDYDKINTYDNLKKLMIKAVKKKDFNIIEPLISSSSEKEFARRHFKRMLEDLERKRVDVDKLKDFKIFFIDRLQKIHADNYYAEISLVAKDKNNNFVDFFKTAVIHYKKSIYIKKLDDDVDIAKSYISYYEPIKDCIAKKFNNVLCVKSKAEGYVALPQFLKININSPEEVYKGLLSLKTTTPNEEVSNQLKKYIKNNFSTYKMPSDNRLVSFVKEEGYKFYLSDGKIVKYYRIYKDDLKKFLTIKLQKKSVKKKILRALGE